MEWKSSVLLTCVPCAAFGFKKFLAALAPLHWSCSLQLSDWCPYSCPCQRSEKQSFSWQRTAEHCQDYCYRASNEFPGPIKTIEYTYLEQKAHQHEANIATQIFQMLGDYNKYGSTNRAWRDVNFRQRFKRLLADCVSRRSRRING